MDKIYSLFILLNVYEILGFKKSTFATIVFKANL